jgi:hypothetical protein
MDLWLISNFVLNGYLRSARAVPGLFVWGVVLLNGLSAVLRRPRALRYLRSEITERFDKEPFSEILVLPFSPNSNPGCRLWRHQPSKNLLNATEQGPRCIGGAFSIAVFDETRSEKAGIEMHKTRSTK